MMDREEDQNQAMQVAEPILVGLHNVLADSVGFYFGDAYTDKARAEHTDRAQANCIYSHAEKRMIGLAETTKGLHIINRRSLVVANYQDKGLFRFKKVKPNGKHSNYQTQQQQDYDDQKTFPEFPPAAIRMTAGYELDESGMGVKRIMIARPIGKTIFWTAQVVVDAGAAQWEDITPRRFGLADGIDFDADKVRERRRGR
jgi:hypothetical protein